MKFYNINNEELQKELETDFSIGLTSDQVMSRSVLCENKSYEPFNIINAINFNFIKSAVFALLSALVFVIYALFFKDAYNLIYFITVTVTVMVAFTGFYFYVTYLNKKIDCKNKTAFNKLWVLRDGQKTQLSFNEILFGDIVFLSKGDYIPFDARIIQSESFNVDESSVTSISVKEKHSGIVSDENSSASELFNMVFLGSFVLSGEAKVVVTDVGKRTYFLKTHKKERNDYKAAPKLKDIFRIILLIITFISSAFTLAFAFISKDFTNLISLLLIFLSLFFIDFIGKYISVLFANCILKLNSKNIFVKDSSVIDKINDIDVVLWNSDVVFDGNISIKSFFVSQKYYSISELDKNHLELFIFSALASVDKSKNKFKDSVLKILKKFNVKYDDLEKLCPSISYYCEKNSNLELCGRIYDGHNLLIAKGRLTDILEMCSEGYERTDAFKQLSFDSTDVIGVAVKNVDVIDNSLASEKSGFTFIGAIALKKSMSESNLSLLNSFGKYSVSNIILFDGTEESAKAILNETDFSLISYDEFINLDVKHLSGTVLVYDFNGKIDLITNKFYSSRVKTICFYSHNDVDNKSLSIGSKDFDSLEMSRCDIICENRINTIYECFSNVKSVFSVISELFLNIFFIFAIYCIGGLIFTLINKTFLFNSQLFVVCSFCALTFNLIRNTYLNHNRYFYKSFLSRNALISISVSILTFVLYILLLSLILKPGVVMGMCTVSCLAYLSDFIISKKIRLTEIVSLVPTALFAFLFILPTSAGFGVVGFNIISALISIVFGILTRYLTRIIISKLKD